MLRPMKAQPTFSATRRLALEFKSHRVVILPVILLGLVISAIQPASVKVTQLIIDGLQKGASEFPVWLPLSLIGLFVISGLAKYFYNVIRRTLCEKVLIRFRQSLFAKYLHLPMSHLDRMRAGDMLSNIQNDLHQISSGFDTLWDVLKEPFTFLGLIAAAFYFDWRLTLITLAAIPLVAWLFSWSGGAVKRHATRNLAQYADLLSLSQEVLVGSRIVRVFRLEKVLGDKFNEIQRHYFETAAKSIRVQEISTPAVELIGAALMAGVILYGSQRISAGQMTAGDLIAFVIALGLAQMPIKKLNNAHLKMRQAEAAAERIYDLLDKPSPLLGAPAIGGVRERIVYDAVELEYDGHIALRGVSFEVPVGSSVAVVGQSGGGKTSIVNLLPRLYELTGGRILLDGRDIRDWDLAALRSLISYVTQDVFLFNDSIFENIRFGRPDASRKDIEEAADRAHCLDFIRRLPKGGDSMIGDRGMRLSGGERQRIAIARAMLKGAPILILDEATSSLDSSSESVVQSALDELMEGKTSLIVAHRLSTVRRADQIIVIEEGRLLERGTHDSLLEKSGTYHGLFQRQAFNPGPAGDLSV